MKTTIFPTSKAYQVFNPITKTQELFNSLLQAVSFCRCNGFKYSVSI